MLCQMVQNKTSNSHRTIINNAASCELFHKFANFYGSNFKESACRRPKFDLWVGKIPLEKGMATLSGILAWRIPWTEEPGRLEPMGSQRTGYE